MIGIYMITNTITGAKYIGQSIDIERRFMEHRTPNASLKTKSAKFASDIKRYGINSFSLQILEECERSELNRKENEWIRKLNPEYNTVGKPMPQEIKNILSEHGKRQWEEKSEDEKQRICREQLTGPKVGHDVRPETRKKLHDAIQDTGMFAVRVIETGEVFATCAECAKALHRTRCSIYNQLHGRTKTVNGYHLERVETNRDECSGVGQG